MNTPSPRRVARLLLCGLWLSGIAGIAIATTPQQFQRNIAPEKVGANPAEIARMDALLQSQVDEPKVGSIGSIVGFVDKGGKIVYERAFGW